MTAGETVEQLPVVIDYVGWGGKPASVVADFDLGYGVLPRRFYGPRAVVWDAAFGIVNGFRPSAIVYYVLTRSLSPRILHLAWRHEGLLIDGRQCPGMIGDRYCPICARRYGNPFTDGAVS
ncbi:hypothetical protein [Herbiconiux sp. VKM Ac-2851]|uniref:hypothetical protein n=1 Tax=Herbiconiux sp. VKM Ac-2851 TaxID=2739025 RepID=UPI001567C659|nr:hypothetical protein [Herbiconiux sp. VKM Ac-2851]NQX36278.1 hypothetical protein [Herbiconiux sp. VKM Ac-2851]